MRVEGEQKILLGDAPGEIYVQGAAVRLDMFHHSLEQAFRVLEKSVNPRKDTLRVQLYLPVLLRKSGRAENTHGYYNNADNTDTLHDILKQTFPLLFFRLTILNLLSVKIEGNQSHNKFIVYCYIFT
jgi:hypothetical protein